MFLLERAAVPLQLALGLQRMAVLAGAGFAGVWPCPCGLGWAGSGTALLTPALPCHGTTGPGWASTPAPWKWAARENRAKFGTALGQGGVKI